MVDDLDRASERMEFHTSIAIQNARDKAISFQKGSEGECDLCGEHFSRVIEVENNGERIKACGRCRDKHGIP